MYVNDFFNIIRMLTLYIAILQLLSDVDAIGVAAQSLEIFMVLTRHHHLLIAHLYYRTVSDPLNVILGCSILKEIEGASVLDTNS